MAGQPPLEPDEILTPEGIRVQFRRPAGGQVRAGLPPLPAALLVLAAAPVVVPIAAAAAAAVVGIAAAATGADVARRVLGPLAPPAWQPGAGVGTVQVRWPHLEVRWTYGR